MPKKGSYYVKEAKKAGLTVKPGRGSHMKVYGDAGRGYMTIPVHGELGRGLESKILKWFKTLGVIIAMIIIAISVFIR